MAEHNSPAYFVSNTRQPRAGCVPGAASLLRFQETAGERNNGLS